MRTVLVRGAGLALVLPWLVACGGDDGSGSGRPDIVVSSNILGDVVRNLVGDAADVEVLLPPNADPHDFSPSARQAASMRESDALVVNGLGFEEGLLDTIEAAEADGVPVLTAAEAVDPLADDPHLFTDPVRVRQAAEHLAEALATEIPALDTPEVADSVAGYLAELDALHAEVDAVLADIPRERRVLVTNHEVFAYFAERYDFEILGAVVPGGSTLAEPSAAELASLAKVIEERDLPAIFADTSSPSRLADALAAEGVDVEVVELYSESLGDAGSEADTYIGMVRTNARRIAAALG